MKRPGRCHVGSLCLLLFTASSSYASQKSEPRLGLGPSAGPAETLVRAVGTGFANSACGIRLITREGQELARTSVGETGSFSAEFRVPSEVPHQRLQIVAEGISGANCGQFSGERARADFTKLEQSEHLVHWRTKAFIPEPGLRLDEIRQVRQGRQDDRVHFLLQWQRLPDANRRNELSRQGLDLVSYAGGNAYVAAMRVSDLDRLVQVEGIRHVGPLYPQDKVSLDLRMGAVGQWARAEDNRVVLSVALHRDTALQQGRAMVDRHDGELINLVPVGPFVIAAFRLEQIDLIAAEDIVESIDAASPRLERLNDGVRDATGASTLADPPYDLDGSGVTVLVYDTGRIDDAHPDFDTRVIEHDGSAISDHATHVAGIIAGDGTNSDGIDSAGNPNGGRPGQWAGMAPAARLRSFGLSFGSREFLYSDLGDLVDDFTTALMNGAAVANMSMGTNDSLNCRSCDRRGDYSDTAAVIDGIVTGAIGGRSLVFFQGAGNERSGRRGCCGRLADCSEFGSIPSPATAKNPLVIGAVNSNDLSMMTTFSSFGPTDDGRLKPDLVAPGDENDGAKKVTSPTFIDRVRGDLCPPRGNGRLDAGEVRNTYVAARGTSMASPAGAGAAALLFDQWRDLYGVFSQPAPHTVKAIFVHTARDFGEPGPDYRFGWGAIDVRAAIDLVRADRSRSLINQASIDRGTQTYTFDSDGVESVKVTLTWDDPAASRLAASTLVNDLDLRLVDPDGVTYQPLVLRATDPESPARPGNDSTNNVEVIVGAPKSGAWTARVTAPSVPMGPQAYTIITPANALRNLPVADACESNESCSGACALPAFRLLRPFDPRIAEDFSTVHEALESWSTRRGDLSLHRSLEAPDRDFFRITLPRNAGRPGSGAPLLECGTVTRRAHGSFGGTATDRVVFWGGAYIQTFRADGGHLIDEPLEVHGGISTHESLAREVIVDCPQTNRVREICLSVGDRPTSDPRERFHEYRVLVDYRIEAQRISGRFEWLRELMDNLADAEQIVTLLPCPGGVFPHCPRLVDQLEVAHGPRLLPDCRADGPGCPMFYLFEWPIASILDLGFSAPREMRFQLRAPDSGKIIAEAESAQGFVPSSDPRNPERVDLRLMRELDEGLYVLQVNGVPDSSFAIRFGESLPPSDGGQEIFQTGG